RGDAAAGDCAPLAASVERPRAAWRGVLSLPLSRPPGGPLPLHLRELRRRDAAVPELSIPAARLPRLSGGRLDEPALLLQGLRLLRASAGQQRLIRRDPGQQAAGRRRRRPMSGRQTRQPSLMEPDT